MNSDMMNVGIFISDLLEKVNADDTDWLMIEDIQNTKKIMFRNFRISLISDIEAPADYRLYSSLKVKELVDKVDTDMREKFGNLTNNFNDLRETAVTQKQLDSAVEGLDQKKTDKTTTEKIVDELQNTRKVTDPITGRDIVCATEEEKIHMEHLGNDVRDAMTGNTPVSVLAAPAGGWPADDIANYSLSALKFTKDFTFRGNVTEGSIDRLVETGIYEVSSDIEKLPHYGDDMDETRMVVVERYGKDAAWIRQCVYYKEFTGEVRPYFERKGMFTKLAILDFVTHFEVTNENKVSTELLGDEYNNRGVIYDGKVTDVTADGNYLFKKDVLGLPINGEDFIITVSNYGTKIEYYAKKADQGGCISFVKYVYPDSSGALQETDWFNITNVSRSKFDGTYIHVFGDGISFGLGASESTSTTYTSILHFKYGYHLSVHALTDATAGNYNEIQSKNSVLKQIDDATDLADADDFLALIFVGGEDYRKGLCPIGNNDYTDEESFKGALNNAVKKILSRCPQAKILFATPIFRGSTEPGDHLSGEDNMVNGKYLEDYANAMVEVAAYNHVPCVDLYHECMINKYNSSFYLTSDGVYPNDKGHALLAEKIHDAFCKFY